MTAVVYPATLPNPTRLTHRPNMRAVISDLPGRPAAGSKERAYSGEADVEFFLTSAQAAAFYTWWTDDLAQGGYWFNTNWPAVLPGLNTCQFVSEPVFTHVYDGAFKVSATVQVRPNSGDLLAPVEGDPFWDDVLYLLLGEGPTDGVQVNPTTGTIVKDEISGLNQGLGNFPFLAGATVSASTSGMPFGNSWIRFPGNEDSNNFIGCSLGPFHPRNNVMTWDSWFQVDDISRVHVLFADDSNFGGQPFNIIVGVYPPGGDLYAAVRTGDDSPAGPSTYLFFLAGVTPNVPFHVEMWGDAAGNWGLALNGVMKTGTVAASDTAGASLLIGCQNPYFAGGYKRVLKGYMKCFRLTAAVRHTASFDPPAVLRTYLPP